MRVVLNFGASPVISPRILPQQHGGEFSIFCVDFLIWGSTTEG